MKKSTFTREELADRWRIKPSTLDRWRRAGKGPQYSKEDSGFSYTLEDVESYEESRTFQSPADYPPELKRKRKAS